MAAFVSLSTTAFLCFECVMQYKIEMRYFYGWDDAKWTEEKDETEKPMRFQKVRQAQQAIEEFIGEVKHAVIEGNMDSEAVRDDFRIVKVNKRH